VSCHENPITCTATISIHFALQSSITYQKRRDPEKQVDHDRAGPVQTSVKEEREGHRADDSETVRVAPPVASGDVPYYSAGAATEKSANDSGDEAKCGVAAEARDG